MPSKYPPTERVTASSLSVGDDLLIRERAADQPVRNTNLEPGFAPGVWQVAEVGAYHRQPFTAGRRHNRYYLVTVVNEHGAARIIDTSAVQRFNRVIR
jgi:hypothetical protein